MIWILSLITFCKINASDLEMNYSARESYNFLNKDSGHVHATTHVTNIIRSGLSGFNQAEKES